MSQEYDTKTEDEIRAIRKERREAMKEAIMNEMRETKEKMRVENKNNFPSILYQKNLSCCFQTGEDRNFCVNRLEFSDFNIEIFSVV